MFHYNLIIKEIEYYIKIYENTITRIRDTEKKEKLIDICEKIKQRYDEYINHKNSLEDIEKDIKCIELKKELISCYEKNKEVTKELNEIIQEQKRQIQSLCPLCGLDHYNQKEHYLPKTEFPEYSIFIPNITPVCNTCNIKKSSKITNDNFEKQFFNIYFDKLPTKKILDAKISFYDKIPVVKFYLLDEELKNELSDKEVKVIKSHFKNLDLLNRYERASTDVISERITMFKNMLDAKISEQQIKEVYQGMINSNIKIYGENYWKNVLESSILENKFNEFYENAQFICKESTE